MAKEKVRSHKKKPGASKEALTTKGRVVVSTGGGEPIPKGETWTDEKREEDAPRTDDGKFADKSSIGKTTKYPKHGWRGTYEKGHPLNPEGKKLSEEEKKRIWEEDVKETPDIGKDVVQHYAQKMKGKIDKGTEFAINDAIFITAIEMTVDEFADYLRYAWQGKEAQLGALSDALIRKKGKRSEDEKKALERVKTGINGERDAKIDPYRIEVVTDAKGKEKIAKLNSKETKKKIKEAAKAYKERLQKGFPKYDMDQVFQKRSLERQGHEYETHYKPDSDKNDKHVQDVLNSGDKEKIGALLSTRRYMDDTKFTLSEAIDRVSPDMGMGKDEIIDMLKSGDIKLSDIKAALRGE